MTDIDDAIFELVQMGMVKASGRKRNGQTAWELTEFGRLCAEFYEQVEGALPSGSRVN
jgi:hypothetical protein